MYGCSRSSCNTTRTTVAENCDTCTSVIPPRATRSYADGVPASEAPLISTTTRYGASRVKSWSVTGDSTPITTSACPEVGTTLTPVTVGVAIVGAQPAEHASSGCGHTGVSE